MSQAEVVVVEEVWEGGGGGDGANANGRVLHGEEVAGRGEPTAERGNNQRDASNLFIVS